MKRLVEGVLVGLAVWALLLTICLGYIVEKVRTGEKLMLEILAKLEDLAES